MVHGILFSPVFLVWPLERTVICCFSLCQEHWLCCAVRSAATHTNMLLTPLAILVVRANLSCI